MTTTVKTENRANRLTCKKFEVMRSGKMIRGLQFKEAGEQSEKLPAVIVCHGFMTDYRSVVHYAMKLAELGYAAFCFDFIGGGLESTSDGEMKDMTLLTEVEDLHAVIRHIAGLPYIDSENISLMGCSQGGFAAAIAAAQLSRGERDDNGGDNIYGDDHSGNPITITKLILFYPGFSMPEAARSGRMIRFKFDPANIPETLQFADMILSGDYASCVIKMDPFEEIAGYKGKILLVHGDRDRIVNISYAEKTKELFGDACEFHIIPGAGHIFNEQTDKEQVIPILEKYMRRR